MEDVHRYRRYIYRALSARAKLGGSLMFPFVAFGERLRDSRFGPDVDLWTAKCDARRLDPCEASVNALRLRREGTPQLALDCPLSGAPVEGTANVDGGP